MTATTTEGSYTQARPLTSWWQKLETIREGCVWWGDTLLMPVAVSIVRRLFMTTRLYNVINISDNNKRPLVP